MRYERSLPASRFSAGELLVDMERKVEAAGFNNSSVFSEIKATWDHEMAHKDTFGGSGEFAYSMEIGDSSGNIVVGWVASFTPHIEDEVDPLRMIRTAMAPGAAEMSEQDKRVADYWWDVYLRQLEEKELEALKQDTEDGEETINNPISNVDKEEFDDMDKETTPEAKVIKIFVREIDKMVEQGKFPTRSEVIASSREDIFVEYQEELREAFNNACNKVGLDPFGCSLIENDENEDADSRINEDIEDGMGGVGVVYQAGITEGIIN